jgi:hypothetical protein
MGTVRQSPATQDDVKRATWHTTDNMARSRQVSVKLRPQSQAATHNNAQHTARGRL